ncbi:hypothetical protein RB11757 [Rhodopirellula baltica SH 1]|uniref:Uncharacterized protein n=1 Tax=Rhodopirellula baltica (strain DSM 10527 / NCIMB 13988 / SH1) TaxID=243090 RepID=Q7UDV7_RHOBA|nr:hypothetical protein RB11757 [Rhodopirellula baltica SH 1]
MQRNSNKLVFLFHSISPVAGFARIRTSRAVSGSPSFEFLFSANKAASDKRDTTVGHVSHGTQPMLRMKRGVQQSSLPARCISFSDREHRVH